MVQELIYTSAPRGLRPGTSGYATVACTRGMPANVVEALESLSGYRPAYPAGDARAALNPISFAHRRLALAGRTLSVLSRVAFDGFDHTGRTNKLAHHLVLERSEWGPAGPARLLQQTGLLRTAWEGEPRYLEVAPALPESSPTSGPARAWARVAGDPGWAGALAECAASPSPRPVYVVHDPGLDVLSLFAEAISVLPPGDRWLVTFDTYVTSAASTSPVLWRGCLPDSPIHAEALRTPGALVLDLRPGQIPDRPADSPYVAAARAGEPLRIRPAVRPAAASRPKPAAPAAPAPVPAAPLDILPEPVEFRRSAAPLAPASPPPRPSRVGLVILGLFLFLSLVANAIGLFAYLRARGRSDDAERPAPSNDPLRQRIAQLQVALEQAEREVKGLERQLKVLAAPPPARDPDPDPEPERLPEPEERPEPESKPTVVKAPDPETKPEIEQPPRAAPPRYVWLPLPVTLPQRLELHTSTEGVERIRFESVKDLDVKELEPRRLALKPVYLPDSYPLRMEVDGPSLRLERDPGDPTFALEAWKLLRRAPSLDLLGAEGNLLVSCRTRELEEATVTIRGRKGRFEGVAWVQDTRLTWADRNSQFGLSYERTGSGVHFEANPLDWTRVLAACNVTPPLDDYGKPDAKDPKHKDRARDALSRLEGAIQEFLNDFDPPWTLEVNSKDEKSLEKIRSILKQLQSLLASEFPVSEIPEARRLASEAKAAIESMQKTRRDDDRDATLHVLIGEDVVQRIRIRIE